MTRAVTRLPANVRAIVEEMVLEASAVVRDAVTRINIEIKGDGSPVTCVDLAVECVIRSRLEKAYPDHGIVGEEYGSSNPDAQWTWLIDPIDGTRQFAAGLPNYGILIALCEGVRPRVGVICQPILGDVYLGISGEGAWRNGTPIRVAATEELCDAIICFSDPDAFDERTRPGLEALRTTSRWNVYDGGCLSFATLASGYVGVSIYGPNLDSYDFCALVPVVEEAGGIISDWYGEPLNRECKSPILASCSRAIHESALETLAFGRRA
jgi:histidinol phosphatase-like enzyme (inositol monophosphatase family)